MTDNKKPSEAELILFERAIAEVNEWAANTPCSELRLNDLGQLELL